MTVRRWAAAAMFLGVLTTTPVLAQEGRSRGGDRGDGGARSGSTGRHAVPRGHEGGRIDAGRSAVRPRSEAPRVYSVPPRTAGRGVYSGERDMRDRGPLVRRDVRPGPDYPRSRYADRDYAQAYRDRGYVGRAVPRAHVDRRYVPPHPVGPRYYGHSRAYGYDGLRFRGNPRYYHYAPGFGSPGWRGGWGRTIIVPRYVHPRVVTVLPYQPYYYRPSIALGVYYGTDGHYPFGDVPSYYYDPAPGSRLGGVRITDAPRDAQVFADGYYAGIVDDFDGWLQHLNLEPGPHRIEIHTPASGAVAFDVVVQPGRTITLRADVY